MVFAVNIGNSRISVGAFEKDEIVFTAAIETRKKATSWEYANNFLQIFSLYGRDAEGFSGGVISSVVPRLTPVIKEALEMIVKGKVLVVSAGVKTGLEIKRNNSLNLGSDLVCAAVGAIMEKALPCVVVSLGTATTFTVIDREGRFLGTSIAAGMQISLEALREKAARLPEIELEPPSDMIGMHTAESMKSGVFYGTACLCDGMCDRFRRELGEETTFFMTGQYAKLILPFCENDYRVDENLLLKGLNRIYHKNVK